MFKRIVKYYNEKMKLPLTVGDLKPGDRFIIPNESDSGDMVLLQHPQNEYICTIPNAKVRITCKTDHCVIILEHPDEKSLSVISISESTPCELVEGGDDE